MISGRTPENTTGLQEQLNELKHGDHLCLIYENEAEQLASLLPFIQAGVAKGERCLYIANDGMAGKIAAALVVAGVDLDGATENCGWVVMTARDAYLQDGSFSAEKMISSWQQWSEQA